MSNPDDLPLIYCKNCKQMVYNPCESIKKISRCPNRILKLLNLKSFIMKLLFLLSLLFLSFNVIGQYRPQQTKIIDQYEGKPSENNYRTSIYKDYRGNYFMIEKVNNKFRRSQCTRDGQSYGNGWKTFDRLYQAEERMTFLKVK